MHDEKVTQLEGQISKLEEELKHKTANTELQLQKIERLKSRHAGQQESSLHRDQVMLRNLIRDALETENSALKANVSSIKQNAISVISIQKKIAQDSAAR